MKLKTLCLLSLLALAGCAGQSANPLAFLSQGDPEFDGVWVGEIRFGVGSESCPRRAGLRAEIANGSIGGQIRWDGRPGRFSGVIQDGVLKNAAFERGSRDFADVTGAFTEREAEGEWRSPRCSGTWSMRKTRDL